MTSPENFYLPPEFRPVDPAMRAEIATIVTERLPQADTLVGAYYLQMLERQFGSEDAHVSLTCRAAVSRVGGDNGELDMHFSYQSKNGADAQAIKDALGYDSLIDALKLSVDEAEWLKKMQAAGILAREDRQFARMVVEGLLHEAMQEFDVMECSTQRIHGLRAPGAILDFELRETNTAFRDASPPQNTFTQRVVTQNEDDGSYMIYRKYNDSTEQLVVVCENPEKQSELARQGVTTLTKSTVKNVDYSPEARRRGEHGLTAASGAYLLQELRKFVA